MSTITLPNIRVSSDLTVGLKLKDGGVAIDWSTLSNIRVSIYADAQRSLAGRCTVAIDEDDNTVLVCQYAANKPQYLGVNRVIVQCTYMGETKTYDKPAFNFVRWTDDQEGEEITISDPDVDVEIEVEDVSSSILNQAIAAALQAAEDAEHAAHLIPNQVLLDCEQATAGANAAAEAANAAGITSVNVSVEDNEPGTPSAECSLANKVLSVIFHYLKGATGDAAGFGTITASFVEDGGDPSVLVTTSGPDTAKNIAFTLKNFKGDKGDKGDQGNTGSSVDYPYELVNNCTTDDATKGLSAAQGKALKDELSQLDLKLNDFVPGKVTNFYDENAPLLQGYINASGGFNADTSGKYLTAEVPVKKGVVYSIGLIGVGPFSSLWISAWSNGSSVQIHNEIGNSDTSKLTYGTDIRSFSVNHDNPSVRFTVKFTSDQDARGHIALIEGNAASFPSTYVPYNIYIKKQNIDPALLAEINEKVQYTPEEGKNLINPDAVQLNKYIGFSAGTGLNASQPSSQNGAACSGLIPITPGKTYYLTRGSSSVVSSCFCFIEEDGTSSIYPLDPATDTALSLSECNNKSRAYKAPSNAKYALICLALSGWTDTETQIVGYQFEEGDTPTAYVPYVAPKMVIPAEHISSEITDELAKLDAEVNGEKANTFVFSPVAGNISYIKSPFDDTNDFKASFYIKRTKGRPGGLSECFSFYGTALVNKSTGVETSIDGGDDDICPVYFFNGGYLGANHGYDKFYKVTASSHGKTYADIGSVYSDGTHTFVILDIVDSNNLIMGGESTDTYPIWNSVPSVATGTYTHISGGTNTGNIVATAATVSQGKPVEKLDETVVAVDGVRVSQLGTYKFKDTVIISQNYKIANYSSILNVLKANVGTYTDHPDYSELEGVDYCAKLSISYIYTDAAHLFVSQSITFLQTQEFGLFGFIQKAAFSGANTRLYIPKALPVANADNLDFRTNPLYGITVSTYISSSYFENPNLPPDRFIMSNNNIAFSSGYLFDYGVGGNNRKDMVENAILLNYPTKKIYPRGIDKGKVGATQTKGSNYSAVCFRNFSPVGTFNQDGKLLLNSFEYNGKLYIYADFNATGIYEMSIPEKFIGKTVEVFEKSANVELLTKVSSDTILFQVETASPMYGYFVAKIS